MYPHPSLMASGGKVPPPIFRSMAVSLGYNLGTSGSLVTKPAGAAVGDLVIVWLPHDGANPSTMSTSGGATWAKISGALTLYSYQNAVFWKILNATDVANSWSFSNSLTNDYEAFAVCYSNNSVAFIGVTSKYVMSTAANQTTATMTGFVPAGLSRGAVACFTDRDGAYCTLDNDGDPTGFVDRVRDKVSGAFNTIIADNVYYSGGNVVWTNTAGGNPIYGEGTSCAEAGHLLEIT